MNLKKIIKSFVTFFIAGFVSNIIIVYLWNLIFYGKGSVDWKLALTLGITIAIVVTIIMPKELKTK